MLQGGPLFKLPELIPVEELFQQVKVDGDVALEEANAVHQGLLPAPSTRLLSVSGTVFAIITFD